MAVYVFRCARCFESVQVESPIGEPPSVPTCPCGNVMSRRWSAPGIVLKGSGWGRDK
jgi:putative FmdB family regulatory protein